MVKKNKLKQIGLISLAVVIGVIFFYFLYLFVTVDGKIVEDRPLLEKVCEFRGLCRVTDGGGWSCGLWEYDDPDYKELRSWKGFQGCNESTKYYLLDKAPNGREYGSIKGIKSCYCRGFFG